LHRYPFTSESVTEGHPDKMADQISDAILDAILADDLCRGDGKPSRVAAETFVNTGHVIAAGEISTEGYIDIRRIVRDTIKKIGYDGPASGFNGDTCGVMVDIDEQSPDISAAVDKDDPDKQGAGDQGMMFGYACNETDSKMPLPVELAHRLAQKLAEVRRKCLIPYLCPDGKTQVTIRYCDGRPVCIETVVVSTQHREGYDRDTMIKPDVIQHVVDEVLNDVKLPDGTPVPRCDNFKVHVNPSGNFVVGGPIADAGLTGRKIIVDTYGGMARHGGGAFSGKDPSKVDRSGAYAARWIAKNLVCAGAAERCEVQIAYAIGVAEPVSVMVETFGTHNPKLGDGCEAYQKISEAVRKCFDLRPAAIVRDLGLRYPIYSETAAYGHFGRKPEKKTLECPDGTIHEFWTFPWERCDKVDCLRRELGLQDQDES